MALALAPTPSPNKGRPQGAGWGEHRGHYLVCIPGGVQRSCCSFNSCIHHCFLVRGRAIVCSVPWAKARARATILGNRQKGKHSGRQVAVGADTQGEGKGAPTEGGQIAWRQVGETRIRRQAACPPAAWPMLLPSPLQLLGDDKFKITLY